MTASTALATGTVGWTFDAPGADTVSVTFTASAPIVHASAPVPTTVVLAREALADGGTVTLNATDDPDVSPAGWTWVAHLRVDGRLVLSFPFELPSGASIDLADLAPVPDSTGTPVTRGPVGPAGPTGPQGPAGTPGADGADAEVTADAVAAVLPARLSDVALKAASVAAVQEAIEAGDLVVGSGAGGSVPGRHLAALGDSITAGITGNTTPDPNNTLLGSYLMYGTMASQGRLEWGGQFGIPGDTTAQILARVNQVIAAKPDMCIVLGGTNDGDMSTVKANLPQVYNALIAAGIEPIVATLPPSSSSNALSNGPHIFIRIANAWLSKYAAAHGLRIVDFFGALVDPATGKFKAGHNSDITHPNQTGYRAMGQAVSDALSSQVKAGTSWLTQDLGEFTLMNQADGGLFTTGTTLPNGGWEQTVGPAGAFVTDAYFKGRGYQIARAAGDSATRVITHYLGAFDWTFQPGDLVSLSCKVKTAGLQASGGSLTVSVGTSGSSGAANVVSWKTGADFPDGGVIYYESVVGPGTATLVTQIRVDGGGNVAGDSCTVGQFGVRNLTRGASYP